MKHQGYNARLDESLGMKHGKKSQTMKDRRDESKAMSKKLYGHAYGGDHSMTYESHGCLLYTSPSPRDRTRSRMPSSA